MDCRDPGWTDTQAAWLRADIDRGRLEHLLGAVESVGDFLRDAANRTTDPDTQQRIRLALARLDEAKRIVRGK